MRRLVQVVGVMVIAVLLTTVTIDATDALRGSQSALSLLAKNVTTEECPPSTSAVELSSETLCIDTYENSASVACPHLQPASSVATAENLVVPECGAVSTPNTQPWTFVTYHQAKTLCAAKGMRLPTPAEWYEGALGTPDTTVCNTNGGLSDAGSFSECRSARGAYDMVGNVWEWVEAQVQSGAYNGRSLPPEGYVTEADLAGVAVATADQPTELFGEDYFWLRSEGVAAMMRGGYYGSRSDAGIFSVHTNVTPSFASAATGFRCVQTK